MTISIGHESKKKIDDHFVSFLKNFGVCLNLFFQVTDDVICLKFCNFWNTLLIGYLVNPLQQSWECPSSWSYSRCTYVLTISILDVTRKHLFKHTNALPFINHDWHLSREVTWEVQDHQNASLSRADTVTDEIHVERSLCRYVRKVDLRWVRKFFRKGSRNKVLRPKI